MGLLGRKLKAREGGQRRKEVMEIEGIKSLGKTKASDRGFA